MRMFGGLTSCCQTHTLFEVFKEKRRPNVYTLNKLIGFNLKNKPTYIMHINTKFMKQKSFLYKVFWNRDVT